MGQPVAGRMPVWLVGIFLFNIIVGTGAFALPHLFAKAGLALGTIFLVLVTALAFMSASFLVEAQAAATLLQLARHGKSAAAVASADPDSIAYVDQTSTIVSVLMPGWGPVLWFVTIILYLATDLAVYAVFIPSTLRDVLSDGIRSGSTIVLAPDAVYSVALVALGIIATPMVFFSLKKTTLLQVSTTVVRHAVFWTMIIAAAVYFSKSCAMLQSPAPSAMNSSSAMCTGVVSHGCGLKTTPNTDFAQMGIDSQGTVAAWSLSTAASTQSREGAWGQQSSEAPSPTAATHILPKTVIKEMELSAIPLLFGGAVYALICQQYIAGMLGPIASRRWATPTIGIVFIVVLVYYLALCWTAVVAYVGTPLPPPPQSTPTISGECQCTATADSACPPQSLYTLNFGYLGIGGTLVIVAPLLSLLSSFPVIAITLRDNMIVLYWYLTGRGDYPERDPLVKALACCKCCLTSLREQDEPDLDDASAMVAPDADDETVDDDVPGWQDDGSPVGPSAISPVGRIGTGRRGSGEDDIPHTTELDAHRVINRAYDSPVVPILEADSSTASLSVQIAPKESLSSSLLASDHLGHGRAVKGVGTHVAQSGAASNPDEIMAIASRYSDMQHHHGPTVGELRDLADLVAGPARRTRAPPSSTQNAPLALRIVFGLLAVAPAFTIAFLTDSVDLLVGITGGYGGALIMYVIPGLLLFYSRRLLNAIDLGEAPDHDAKDCPDDPALDPDFSSAAARRWEHLRRAKTAIMEPSMSCVKSPLWALPPMVFGFLCIIFNTYNLIAGN